MSKIELSTDIFDVHQEKDMAVVNMLEGEKILSTTIKGKEDALKSLNTIHDAKQIKGVAVLYSDQYQGDAEYEKFLKQNLDAKHYFERSRYTTIYKYTIIQFLERLVTLPKPIVGGMDGDIGPTTFAINLAFDFRIATENAIFIHPNLKLGLPPAPLLSYFLVQSLGLHKTTELLLTKERISSEEALDLGLITQIVSKEELKKTCIDKLRLLSTISGDALAETRLMLMQDMERLRNYVETGFDRAVRCMYKKTH